MNEDLQTAYADGHPEPYENFPYHEIDRGNPLAAVASEASPDFIPNLADGLSAILAHVWQTDTGTLRNRETAFLKFLALSSTVRPDLVGDLSFAELGEYAGGSTKQALSHYACVFQDTFGLKAARSRSKVARQNMKGSMLNSYAKRRATNAT